MASFDPGEFDLFTGTASDIAELTAEMAAADHALYWARQELDELREKREAARQRAYRELSDYRGWVREVLTPEELEKKQLRFHGETARTPSPLVRQADAVIAWASDEEDPPPASKHEKAVVAGPPRGPLTPPRHPTRTCLLRLGATPGQRGLPPAQRPDAAFRPTSAGASPSIASDRPT